MLLALLGVGVAGAFALLASLLATVLPADVWSGVEALAAPLAFLVPPLFAASVPIVIAAILSFSAVRWILKLVG